MSIGDFTLVEICILIFDHANRWFSCPRNLYL